MAPAPIAVAATDLVRPAPAPPQPWTAHGYIPIAGGRLHYATLGDGPALVVLHKLGGQLSDWRKAAPLLAAAGRRVIAFDLPGHGQSVMRGPAPYVQTAAETAAGVMAALADLGVDRFSLVGNSLGGCVSVLMAALCPDKVERLVLLSASLAPAISREETRRQDALKVARGEFTADDRPLPRSAEELRGFGFTDPEVIAEDQAGRALAGRWVRASERGAGMAGSPDYMPRVQAPVLMMLALSGNYLRFEALASERLKRLRVLRVPDTGSFIHMEKPQVAAAAINAFLDEPEPTSAAS